MSHVGVSEKFDFPITIHLLLIVFNLYTHLILYVKHVSVKCCKPGTEAEIMKYHLHKRSCCIFYYQYLPQIYSRICHTQQGQHSARIRLYVPQLRPLDPWPHTKFSKHEVYFFHRGPAFDLLITSNSENSGRPAIVVCSGSSSSPM